MFRFFRVNISFLKSISSLKTDSNLYLWREKGLIKCYSKILLCP